MPLRYAALLKLRQVIAALDRAAERADLVEAAALLPKVKAALDEANGLGPTVAPCISVKVYRSPDGMISFDGAGYGEELQAALAEGYRIGEGIGDTGEGEYVFGRSTELGMTAAQAVERGVLVLLK